VIAETVLCTIATLVTVAIMYAHSQYAYGERVPRWMLVWTRLSRAEETKYDRQRVLLLNDDHPDEHIDDPTGEHKMNKSMLNVRACSLTYSHLY
jgi:hypothetical protein